MSTFISIPVTGSDNYIINSQRIITCVRTSATTTIIVVEGGTGSSTSTDRIEITHAADTASASVAHSIMASVVMSSGASSGAVRVASPAQAISSINFSGSAGTIVTSVTASAPLSSSGGTTPNITISQANTTDNGYLSSTDWNTFNNKGNGDMLASTYDPTGVAADVYNYANQIGLTQMPTSQILRYTESGGGSVDFDDFDAGTSNILFLDPGAHDRDFTGIVAPAAGVNRMITIINSGTNKKLKFKDNDTADSVAANCFYLPERANFDLAKGGSYQVIYDHNVSRWASLSYY